MKQLNGNSAIVYFKNGKTKYGFLVNFSETAVNALTSIKFLCNTKVSEFDTTLNYELIETLDRNEIEVIDAYLK